MWNSYKWGIIAMIIPRIPKNIAQPVCPVNAINPATPIATATPDQPAKFGLCAFLFMFVSPKNKSRWELKNLSVLYKDYIRKGVYIKIIERLYKDYINSKNPYIKIIYINKLFSYLYLYKQNILYKHYIKSLLSKESPDQEILIYINKDYIKSRGFYV